MVPPFVCVSPEVQIYCIQPRTSLGTWGTRLACPSADAEGDAERPLESLKCALYLNIISV